MSSISRPRKRGAYTTGILETLQLMAKELCVNTFPLDEST